MLKRYYNKLKATSNIVVGKPTIKPATGFQYIRIVCTTRYLLSLFFSICLQFFGNRFQTAPDLALEYDASTLPNKNNCFYKMDCSETSGNSMRFIFLMFQQSLPPPFSSSITHSWNGIRHIPGLLEGKFT